MIFVPALGWLVAYSIVVRRPRLRTGLAPLALYFGFLALLCAAGVVVRVQ